MANILPNPPAVGTNLVRCVQRPDGGYDYDDFTFVTGVNNANRRVPAGPPWTHWVVCDADNKTIVLPAEELFESVYEAWAALAGRSVLRACDRVNTQLEAAQAQYQRVLYDSWVADIKASGAFMDSDMYYPETLHAWYDNREFSNHYADLMRVWRNSENTQPEALPPTFFYESGYAKPEFEHVAEYVRRCLKGFTLTTVAPTGPPKHWELTAHSWNHSDGRIFLMFVLQQYDTVVLSMSRK